MWFLTRICVVFSREREKEKDGQTWVVKAWGGGGAGCVCVSLNKSVLFFRERRRRISVASLVQSVWWRPRNHYNISLINLWMTVTRKTRSRGSNSLSGKTPFWPTHEKQPREVTRQTDRQTFLFAGFRSPW